MSKTRFLYSSISIILIFLSTKNSIAQNYNFKFYQEIKGISNQWHKIELPNELFGVIKPNFADIRILGITKNNDTIEAPYILQLKNDIPKNAENKATIINSSKNKNGYYNTLTFSEPNIINQFYFSINQSNFDWRISIEGSQNQDEWYSLVENHRILSINTKETSFSYTTVNFNDALYNYYRVCFKSNELPSINYISSNKKEIAKGNSRNYSVYNTNSTIDKTTKTSIFTFDLNSALSVNTLKLELKDTIDYYRNYSLYCANDSIKTKDGWMYSYQKIQSGILHSLNDQSLHFSPVIARYFKIEIQNKDNAPLQLEKISASGFVYELIVRFTENADYYLFYSNEKSTAPEYDIAYFENKIPDELTLLTLGEQKETINEQPSSVTTNFSFFNSYWLWFLMIAIIVTLGWFSLSMIRKID